MGPRADFSCKKCQTTYEDLPVQSVRCPICGLKRGFARLFNAIHVSTNGHKVAKVLDPLLAPQINQHAAVKAEVAAGEDRMATEKDKMWEQASPEQRAAIAELGQPVKWATPRQYGQGQTVGPGLLNQGMPGRLSIPAEASAASAWPFVKRRVVPKPA